MAFYKEDIVNIELENGTIFRSFMNHSIGSGDVLENRFGVRVFRNGEPEDIGGTVMGLFMRADGGTVTIASGTVSGNEAYITLPEACYAVEGNFSLAIKCQGSGVTGTLRIVDGVVSRTSTNAIVDPGTILPSIETLLAAIEAAVASIPADYSDLWTTLAPAYTQTAYNVGQYCTYNGHLYKCIVAIPSGEAWTAAHWQQTDIGSNLQTITKAVNGAGMQIIDGTGMTLIERTFPDVYVNGQTINFKIRDWDTTGLTISSSYTRFQVGYIRNGVHNVLVSISTADALLDEYQVEFPGNIPGAVLYVYARIASGTQGYLDISNPGVLTFPYLPEFDNFTQLADFQYIRMSGVRSIVGGYLDEIVFKVRDADDVTLYVLHGHNVLFKVTKTVPAGLVRLKNGVDFDYPAYVEPNCRIGISGASTNRIYFYTDGKPSNQSTYTTANVGEDLTIGSGVAYNVSVGFTIKTSQKEHEERVYGNKYNRVPQSATLLAGDYYYYFDSVRICATRVGGMGTLSLYVSGYKDYDACGCLLYFDFGAWTLSLAKGVDESTISNPEFLETQAITLPYVSGREYYFELYHNRNYTEAKIVDTFTKQAQVISSTSKTAGEGRGKVGYLTTSTMSIRNFVATTAEPFNAKVLVIGDSYSAGNTMWDNMDKRWFELYAAETGAPVSNDSKGGNATYTSSLLLGTPIESAVHPEYVLLELGVNDNSLNNYKGNIRTMIDYVRNVLGAVPVLFTIPPTQNSGSALIYDQINAWIKDSGERYVDMCKALTVDGAGTTRIADYFYSDNVHPNVAGHAAIYAQMKVDMPDLFVGT